MLKIHKHQPANRRYVMLLHRSIAALKEGQPLLAERLLHQALFRQPERPEAYNLLGVLVECTGDWLNSQKFYRAALNMEPTYRAAWNNLQRVTSTGNKCGPVDYGETSELRPQRKKAASSPGAAVRRCRRASQLMISSCSRAIF